MFKRVISGPFQKSSNFLSLSHQKSAREVFWCERAKKKWHFLARESGRKLNLFLKKGSSFYETFGGARVIFGDGTEVVEDTDKSVSFKSILVFWGVFKQRMRYKEMP